ncbi:hypothetical protein C8K58_106466 [Pseudomonas sp. GV047]|nr:hypothetical protein C8K58_106466 [Pseudomonas sp. GV047]
MGPTPKYNTKKRPGQETDNQGEHNKDRYWNLRSDQTQEGKRLNLLVFQHKHQNTERKQKQNYHQQSSLSLIHTPS